MEHRALIEMKRVSVTPPAQAAGRKPPTVLKDIDFTVYNGQWVTLLGRNGSGKSTLAKAAAGFRLSGLKGRIANASRSAEASGKPVPIVMQQPEAALLGATPLEDVVLLLEQNELAAESIIGIAERALRKVGLGERMHQPIGTLSGGQKQLVAIAGCLAMDSPLLMLDEATSMLDPGASRSVLEQARSLHLEGIAVLWITQKLEELREGDRIVVLEDGRIVYDGYADGFYERTLRADGGSICERLGFEAPYPVRVAWELEQLGLSVRPFPYTEEMLAEAVKRYGR
ncbi:ATP-binding cassette domain-containing protein [Paenibacillus arenilitoris]|uniref:ATP-binding cassette domain-containing protein n=1 Tax=Paenibacillus arenilitoris TaxID=2772299 RepID=A0A927CPF2_9BACL|nr:ATP-binding cassette domain-containing protein [Paenibacillus arenilitoris]MBD2870652.1 ATP-binding cassette domain-containing protein [Paenibacillus arenilitoris]